MTHTSLDTHWVGFNIFLATQSAVKVPILLLLVELRYYLEKYKSMFNKQS